MNTLIESIASCFDEVEFDYVFNFAAETKYSQSSEVYEDHILNLSVNCAKEAAKQNVKVFVQFSTAEVYDHKSVTSRLLIDTGWLYSLFSYRVLLQRCQKLNHGRPWLNTSTKQKRN